MTFDELVQHVVGKEIVGIVKGCSLSDDMPGLAGIRLADGTYLDLSGQADCVMVLVEEMKQETANA